MGRFAILLWQALIPVQLQSSALFFPELRAPSERKLRAAAKSTELESAAYAAYAAYAAHVAYAAHNPTK
jgi:hypothetical protein